MLFALLGVGFPIALVAGGVRGRWWPALLTGLAPATLFCVLATAASLSKPEDLLASFGACIVFLGLAAIPAGLGAMVGVGLHSLGRYADDKPPGEPTVWTPPEP